MEQTNRMPLHGIRVIDLTIWVQGPTASMVLADLGAEVIKVEKPGQGDFSRGVQSLFGRPQFLPDGRNLMYEVANRNKKSISVDLRRSEGQQVLYRLAKQSDVLVTNLHPARCESLRSIARPCWKLIRSSSTPTPLALVRAALTLRIRARTRSGWPVPGLCSTPRPLMARLST